MRDPRDMLVVPLRVVLWCFPLPNSICLRFGIYLTSWEVKLILGFNQGFALFGTPLVPLSALVVSDSTMPSSSPISSFPFVTTRPPLRSARNLRRMKALN